MNKYTIHCTEEQTKKALELGAPLIKYNCYIHRFVNPCGVGKESYIIPTAEQMIGWLEEQENIKEVIIYCDVTGLNWSFEGYKDNGNYAFVSSNSYTSRKEATLAAIDATLKYLSNKK